MENPLSNYRITPRVLKQGTIQTITLEGLDDSYRFLDGVEYQIKMIERDGYSFVGEVTIPPKNGIRTTVFQTKSENGILKFQHTFDSEGIWYIHVRCLEQKHFIPLRVHYWPEYLNEPEIVFSVYVLPENLYGLFPFKGDMHMHTFGSDGEHSPALLAARYRKYGFDFISITDHYTIQPSLEAIEKFKDIPTRMKLFPGEEVHHPAGGLYMYHMVNFNPNKSVNASLQNNLETIEKQVKARAEELLTETVDEIDALFIAWHEWIYQQIREANGIAIYPHPYWEILETYNVRESTTREVYKRGLCDVIELFGGTDKANNRLQAQLYYKMREEGYKYPIIASSDAHSTTFDPNFSKLFTIAFAKSTSDLPSAIKEGRAVGIEGLGHDEKTVYGDLQLAQFTYFLLREYYPKHDELCNAAGQAIERFVFGDKMQNTLIELTEKEIEKYESNFFGYTL